MDRTPRGRSSARLTPVALAAAAIVGAATLGSCSGAATPSASDVVQLQVWRHSGTEAETATLDQQVGAFNASQSKVRVEVTTITEGDYNDALQTAAAGGELPDVVEIDGPLVNSYVYQRHLVPLDDLVDADTLENQLPSLRSQGQHNGRTYAVGTFDSGLGLYADRRQLEAADVRWPEGIDDAWTETEFRATLKALAAQDKDGRVLDTKLNYGVGEWMTYGFAPLVASAGGALVGSDLDPRGFMDGEPARRALAALRSWAPFVDANEKDDAFTSRRVALSWVGHWMYGDYEKALGEDLLLLPLPDLGEGTKTGQGSWAWAVTAPEATQEAAASFLEFLLSDDEVLRMSDANGAVPGTESALASSELYQESGPLRLFAEQLLASCGDDEPSRDCVAVPRPATPGYPVLTAQFAEVVAAALRGEDPAPALREATSFVAEDLALNDGYR